MSVDLLLKFKNEDDKDYFITEHLIDIEDLSLHWSDDSIFDTDEIELEYLEDDPEYFEINGL